VILEIYDWDLRLLPIERRAQSSDDSDGWEEPIAATPDDDGCSDSTEGSSENKEAPFSASTEGEGPNDSTPRVPLPLQQPRKRRPWRLLKQQMIGKQESLYKHKQKTLTWRSPGSRIGHHKRSSFKEYKRQSYLEMWAR